MLKVDAIHNPHGAGGDEVARNHPHGGIGHWRIGQTLAERCFNFVTQLSGGFLCAIQRDLIRNPNAV